MPLLVPLVFWNHPAVVMLSLSAGVFLNPAGNAGIGSYKMSITPPELIGRVQSTGQFLRAGATMPLAPVLGGALLAALGGTGRHGRADRAGGAGGPDPDAEPDGAFGAAPGGVGATTSPTRTARPSRAGLNLRPRASGAAGGRRAARSAGSLGARR